MALQRVEKPSREGADMVTWKDKIEKALAARSAGRELRKDKKGSLSTSVRTKL